MALIFFYGAECTHSAKMLPLVDDLEKELGVTVERRECWHDDENEKLRAEADLDMACGGVPLFVNEETGAKICGACEYDALRAWATEKLND